MEALIKARMLALARGQHAPSDGLGKLCPNGGIQPPKLIPINSHLTGSVPAPIAPDHLAPKGLGYVDEHYRELTRARNLPKRNRPKPETKTAVRRAREDEEFRQVVLNLYAKYVGISEPPNDLKDLGVYAVERDIKEAIERNQVTIIMGQTGCGKSSQVNSFLL